VRLSFELIMLQDERFDIAYDDSDSVYRITIYGVDDKTIDAAVAMTLAEESYTQVFIINGIGKIECPSGSLCAVLQAHDA